MQLETLARKLKLLEFGPNEVSSNCKFNEQANGESAIWARTENATLTTVLVINEFELKSSVENGGKLVTAYVPHWIYKYQGKYSVYLLDKKNNIKSNKLVFKVMASNDFETQDLKKTIRNLKDENIKLYIELEKYKEKKPPKFDGWNMSTYHELPWVDNYDWSTFRNSSKDIKRNFIFGLYEDIGIDSSNVDTLLWRHWIVSFAVRYAMEFNYDKNDNLNFVECGVGDGMSAFFSLRELMSYNTKKTCIKPFSMHLYDSWNCLKKEDLMNEEYYIVNRYQNNSFERVKKNLAEFERYITYHVGYIPEVLTWEPQLKQDIVYLHIDLNSVKATLSTLEYFYGKIHKDGIILFDDYGWEGFGDTKEIIDKFFHNKSGVLLKLPTSQAIYFVNN